VPKVICGLFGPIMSPLSSSITPLLVSIYINIVVSSRSARIFIPMQDRKTDTHIVCLLKVETFWGVDSNDVIK
jgi:hypothetical protein